MPFSYIKGRRPRALSLFHPTWRGARSDVLYILINQVQTHGARAHMYVSITEICCHTMYLRNHTLAEDAECSYMKRSSVYLILIN